MNEQEMLNALWHFYEKQPDTGCIETAEICAELVLRHGFDINDLPQMLHTNVLGILRRLHQQYEYDYDKEEFYVGCD